MPSSCCVPGCKSNYKSSEKVKVFQFPERGSPQFEKWMQKIPRKDWTPGNRSVVCILHFKEEQIIKEDRFQMPDGAIKIIPRQRFKLVDETVPCIFPNLPLYLSSDSSASRSCPTERREKLLVEHEQTVAEFLKEDLIPSFETLVKNMSMFLKAGWCSSVTEDRLIFYCLSEELPPKITKSVLVKKDLSIHVFLNDKKLSEELKFLFSVKKNNMIFVERFSQLQNLIPWLENQDHQENLFEKLKRVFGTCVEPQNREIFGSEVFEVLCFLYEQLLLIDRKNAPRYSSKMLSWAFSIFTLSPKCYGEIISSGILTLPKERYLRKLSSILSSPGTCDENEHQNYLKNKCQNIAEKARSVNLLIDEISVRPHIAFGSGSLCGISVNQKLKRATTIQSYMITSIYSSDKDVAALIPVHNTTADELFQWTERVLKLVQDCGYKIVSIITDNNRINRNMLTRLCGGCLQPSIPNPSYDDKIFILFDTVHILKSIRNNWINQRTSGNTFTFPSIKDASTTIKASFSDITSIYEKEKSSIIKYAPKLSFKALNPNNFERQNVSLCLRIFDESNVAALKALVPDSEGTIELLSIVINWWKMVNCKSTRKGMEHRDTYELPFYSIEDQRILYLGQIISWLQAWKDLKLPYKGHRAGKLSEETFCSLIHTTQTLKEIILHRLSVANDQYVLLGKYQTDPLEGRFGQYRQMHGGNYNISVEQVMKAEKRLRLKSLIEMHSTKFGHFKLRNFLVEFGDVKESMDVDIDLKGMDFFSFTEEEENLLPVFIYICGYAAYKMKCKITCKSCAILFITEKEILFELSGEESKNYLLSLDRGKLTYSDVDIVKLFFVCYKIFKLFLSEEYEVILHSPKIKTILTQLVVKKVEELDICRAEECEVCHCPKFDLCIKFIPIFLNIFLNNYTIAKNNYFVSEKGKKRKCNALLSSSSEK